MDPTRPALNEERGQRDWVIARFAETYLLVAEALVRDGKAAEAVEYINTVRRRAAKPGVDPASMNVTAAQVDLDFILDERARELAGEQLRWFDLKRTGTLVERTRLYNRDIRNWFNRGINPFEGTGGALKILRPIPARALLLNEGEFEQNPGY